MRIFKEADWSSTNNPAVPNPRFPSAQALPGADRHLTVVSGDVSDTAALQAAMAQCEQLVHLAAVVDIAPPRDEQHKQQMIQTALDGTSMVLGEQAGSAQQRCIAAVLVVSLILARRHLVPVCCNTKGLTVVLQHQVHPCYLGTECLPVLGSN